MIILDTNVVSEPLRPVPDAGVVAWLDQQRAEQLHLAAPSLAELLLGVEIMPRGKRKTLLQASLAQLLAALFADRTLPFDERAARAYADLRGRARGAGKPISIIDAQIAAIAIARGFSVATRDTGPFKSVGVPVLNPWRL
jgi:toxin FitB